MSSCSIIESVSMAVCVVCSCVLSSNRRHTSHTAVSQPAKSVHSPRKKKLERKRKNVAMDHSINKQLKAWHRHITFRKKKKRFLMTAIHTHFAIRLLLENIATKTKANKTNADARKRCENSMQKTRKDWRKERKHRRWCRCCWCGRQRASARAAIANGPSEKLKIEKVENVYFLTNGTSNRSRRTQQCVQLRENRCESQRFGRSIFGVNLFGKWFVSR